MTGRHPAIRDMVLSIRAETQMIMLASTVVRWRCGRCAFEWERHHAEGVPLRTSTCKRCGRTCRSDNAILPEVTP